MRSLFIGLFGMLIWLAGVGMIILSLSTETAETNLPIIFAILGVGFAIYAMVWVSLEQTARRQKRQHEEIKKALVAIGRALRRD